MKISVFGTGYLGRVSGACHTEVGHDVVGSDVDAEKIQQLEAGTIPIWEPGLDALVEHNVKESSLIYS